MSNDFADHEKRVEEQPTTTLSELRESARADGCCGEIVRDFLHVCLRRAGHDGAHGGSDDSSERDRAIMTNARSFERELLVAKLEAELFNEGEGADGHERGFRAGWNSRARSIVEQLRGGK